MKINRFNKGDLVIFNYGVDTAEFIREAVEHISSLPHRGFPWKIINKARIMYLVDTGCYQFLTFYENELLPYQEEQCKLE